MRRRRRAFARLRSIRLRGMRGTVGTAPCFMRAERAARGAPASGPRSRSGPSALSMAALWRRYGGVVGRQLALERGAHAGMQGPRAQPARCTFDTPFRNDNANAFSDWNVRIIRI